MFSTVSAPVCAAIAPPANALLPVNVAFLMAVDASVSVKTAPPKSVAVLFENVPPSTVR